MFLNDLMQRDINIFCHSSSVAADKEVSAGLKPVEDIFALLEHSMLDVNLIRLISGESGVESG